MTDYNDGNWHGWNGGECPVDADTSVEFRLLERQYLGGEFITFARQLQWNHSGRPESIIAFRVVKRAPREFWLCPKTPRFDRDIIHTKDDGSFVKSGFIHVREVIE